MGGQTWWIRGYRMGACFPKPTPNLGDKYCKTSSLKMPRQHTSFELDYQDRGTQISVYVGRHHKVQLYVRDDFTMKQIKEKVEEVLNDEEQVPARPTKQGVNEETGQPEEIPIGKIDPKTGLPDGVLKIQNLVHRHALPIYHLQEQQDWLKKKKSLMNDPNWEYNQPPYELGKLPEEERYMPVKATHGLLSDDTLFGDIEEKDVDGRMQKCMEKYRMVAALESVHFLAFTADFDQPYYTALEYDPRMRHVDHMGMEHCAMYWAKPENYCVTIDEPIHTGDAPTEVS